MGKTNEEMATDKIVDMIAENEQALNATQNHFDRQTILGRIEGLKIAQQIGVNIAGDPLQSETLKIKLEEATNTINDLLKEKADLTAKVDSAEPIIKNLTDELNDLKKTNDDLTLAIDELSSQKDDALKTIDTLTKEIDTLKKQQTTKE